MADAAFARENLGLGAAGNFSYVSEQHGTACAERAIVSALGGWQVHYFTSHVTREGSKPVDHWVALWTGLHGDYGAANWTWDECVCTTTAAAPTTAAPTAPANTPTNSLPPSLPGTCR